MLYNNSQEPTKENNLSYERPVISKEKINTIIEGL